MAKKMTTEEIIKHFKFGMANSPVRQAIPLLRAAKRDKERLDWLLSNSLNIVDSSQVTDWLCNRREIDAAMKAGKKRKEKTP